MKSKIKLVINNKKQTLVMKMQFEIYKQWKVSYRKYQIGKPIRESYYY